MKISDQTLYNAYLIKHKEKQNRGAITKDSERKKTYEAEWAFARQVKIPRFESVDQAQKFVTKVCKSTTYKKLWEENDRWDKWLMNVDVKQKQTGHGRRTAAFTNGRSITVDPLVGLDAYTMLHELAHCAGNMHHGRSFRKQLLKLVSRFLGTEPAKILKSEFRTRKLACGEARKPLSFEKWVVAKNKMQKIREVK